jgi:hypothetical protein
MKSLDKMINRLKLFIVILTIVFTPLVTIGHAKAYAPELALKDQPIESIVTHFALENGVQPALVLKIMDCESGGVQDTVSDEGHSRGIFQIQKPTWDRFTKEMGEVLNYNSPMDQAKVATWAIAHGHAGEWSTYQAIINGGRYSFYSRQLHKHFVVLCKA